MYRIATLLLLLLVLLMGGCSSKETINPADLELKQEYKKEIGDAERDLVEYYSLLEESIESVEDGNITLSDDLQAKTDVLQGLIKKAINDKEHDAAELYFTFTDAYVNLLKSLNFGSVNILDEKSALEQAIISDDKLKAIQEEISNLRIKYFQ